MKKANIKSFMCGMLTMLIIMCGVTVYADTVKKKIEVSFGSIKKIIINGGVKTPPADKQPFLYKGSYYMPLDYISEAMYKNFRNVNGNIYMDGIKISDKEKKAIFAAIELNLKHAREKNIEAYMNDFSNRLDSSILDTSRAMAEEAFEYDTEITIKSKEISAYDGKTCEVRIISETKMDNGNLPATIIKLVQIQKLIKEEGSWKLTYTYMEKQEY